MKVCLTILALALASCETTRVYRTETYIPAPVTVEQPDVIVY